MGKNTEVIAKAPTRKPGSSTSTEVRKIDNGYVTRTSEWDGKGSYSSKEEYSKEVPGTSSDKNEAGDKALGQAIRYLRDEK